MTPLVSGLRPEKNSETKYCSGLRWGLTEVAKVKRVPHSGHWTGPLGAEVSYIPRDPSCVLRIEQKMFEKGMQQCTLYLQCTRYCSNCFI